MLFLWYFCLLRLLYGRAAVAVVIIYIGYGFVMAAILFVGTDLNLLLFGQKGQGIAGAG